jgi:hypothetical protein
MAQKLAVRVESKNGLARTNIMEMLEFISKYVTPEVIQDLQKLDPDECLCEPKQPKLRPEETGAGLAE